LRQLWNLAEKKGKEGGWGEGGGTRGEIEINKVLINWLFSVSVFFCYGDDDDDDAIML